MLINIIFGMFVGIYFYKNLYLAIISIVFIACVNKFILYFKNLASLFVGCLLGIMAVYMSHRSYVNEGNISYIGNNCIFLENQGLYYVESTEGFVIGDRINFNIYANSIKRINKKSPGTLIIPFVAHARVRIKDFCMESNRPGFWLAILLGDKSYINKQEINILFSSSIYHLIVISGFHLSLIYYIVYTIFMYIVKKSKIVNYYSTIYASYDIIPHIIASCICVYYFLLTLSGISSLRAIIMILMRKSSYSSKTVLLTLMIVSIMYNPLLIFNKGFLLSYIITLLLLERQSSANVSLFACSITYLFNPFSILNNLIGTAIMYILLPVAFIALIVNKVELLNMCDSIIYILFYYLPNYAIKGNVKFIELIAVIHYFYIYTLNAKILYISSIILLLSMIIS